MTQLSNTIHTHRVYLYPLEGAKSRYDIPGDLALEMFMAKEDYRKNKTNRTFLIDTDSFSTTNIDRIVQIKDMEKEKEIASTANTGRLQFEEAKKEIDETLSEETNRIERSKIEAKKASNYNPKRSWECNMCKMWNPMIMYKDEYGHNKADLICKFCNK